MNTTITARGVVERLAEKRDQYAADASRVAAMLGTGPTVEDLDRAEAELLAQLADVHRRRAERAALESEHHAYAEASEFFADLVDRTRRAIEQRTAPARTDQPRPDPDPHAGLPGLVDDSREEIAALMSGEYPTAPATQHPDGSWQTGGYRVVSGDEPPGRLVAESGPQQTQPDDGLAHPVPNPPTPPDEQDEPAAGRRGPRHKKGGRK